MSFLLKDVSVNAKKSLHECALEDGLRGSINVHYSMGVHNTRKVHAAYLSISSISARSLRSNAAMFFLEYYFIHLLNSSYIGLLPISLFQQLKTGVRAVGLFIPHYGILSKTNAELG